MWVIVANRDLATHRDNQINELVGGDYIKLYLSKFGNDRLSFKYNTTQNINLAITFKTESGARRLLENFNSDVQKDQYRNKFYWVKDYILGLRKMTIEEWQIRVDGELSKLDNKYNKQRNKLIVKRGEYK